MIFETAETNRLILRKVTPETYDFIYKAYSDDECIAFLGLSSTDELTIEKEKYAKGISAYDRTFLYFQLMNIKDSYNLLFLGIPRGYLNLPFLLLL